MKPQLKSNVMGLIIDASAGAIGVALSQDAAVVHQKVIPEAHGHAALLMPMIEKLLADKNITIKDIDFIAVTTGPGSFTGVRVGLSAAIGFGIACDVPVYGLTGTEILARLHKTKTVASIVDSRRQELYLQIFKDEETITEVLSLSPDDAAILIEKNHVDIIVGQRLDELPPLKSARLEKIMQLPLNIMAEAAYEKFARGERPQDFPAALYVREPDVSVPKASAK